MAYYLRNAHAFIAKKVSTSHVDTCSTSTSTGNGVDDDIIACASPAKKRLKQTLLQFRNKTLSDIENNEITNAIAIWIAKNSRPVNICNEEGFEDVIKVANGCSTYKLPSRTVN